MEKLFKVFFTIFLLVPIQITYAQAEKDSVQNNLIFLERLLEFFNEDDGVNNNPRAIRVSPLDQDWVSWLKRTGERPPDFSTMPSNYSMPDPLIIARENYNIPVANLEEWMIQKEWIGSQVQQWITGTIPPPPDNLKAEIISEKIEDGITKRQVKLTFGPGQKASLDLDLLIPSGEGPFPVFLTQYTHASWARIALGRGYLICLYAGNDSRDDTDDWDELYYPEYDFSLLMRRAWAAHRAVDYLYTRPEVDKDKIGITGHSRNGKQAILAAAFDQRITACIPSSAGTGGEIPFRYSRERYTIETIKVLTGQTTSWFHPRLRFFSGNEYKLPVDMNFPMALIAPRHLLISTAYTEPYGNPWGAEQMYHSLKKVYKFLGAEDNLAIQQRLGGHGTLPFIIEDYLDFFDYAFGRTVYSPPIDLYWDYSFDSWVELSGEEINPLSFPEQNMEDMFTMVQKNQLNIVKDWEVKKVELLKSINWSLGEMPDLSEYRQSISFSSLTDGLNYLENIIGRPSARGNMGRRVVRGIGELGHGFFYFPVDRVEKSDRLPVVIFLHEYSYSSGFQPSWPYTSAFSIDSIVNKGIAVFTFDFIGMGARIEEGKRFYQRYPNWSKLGRMIKDVKDAVSLMKNLDIIDHEQIFVVGYSLGGTVGLYSAALDDRIKGVAAFGSFTPLRFATVEKGLPGIREYSHIHGLQPRLGFFDGHETRLPFDFNEIIGCIAPRKLYLASPRYDQDASLEHIKYYISGIRKVYDLYGQENNLTFHIPEYYNQFTAKQFNELLNWLEGISD
jgi:dienelactone hydrolase